MRERIQKMLAARGVGSRRQVEAWIVAGGSPSMASRATPGQAVGERDDVRLDGRRLRLDRQAWRRAHRGMAYHRPAQEDIRAGASGSRAELAREACRSPPAAAGFRSVRWPRATAVSNSS